MNDLVVYLVVVPVALTMGVAIGIIATRYVLKKQIEEWKKRIETPDKEQVKNMLTALGQKPSEEQVNRFINLAKSQQDKNKPAKSTKKKK
jgi:uncharacterized protein YneF (UPF0154 family)